MASSEKNVQAFVGDPRMSFCAGGMHPYRLLSYLRVFKEQRAKEWIETITEWARDVRPERGTTDG